MRKILRHSAKPVSPSRERRESHHTQREADMMHIRTLLLVVAVPALIHDPSRKELFSNAKIFEISLAVSRPITVVQYEASKQHEKLDTGNLLS